MQFKVPQFLDIEDKIFGPFTFREFVYLAGGAGACFTLYKLLGLLVAIIPIVIVGGFSLALTFYRPNNKPFIYLIETALKFAVGDKLYIWKRRKNKISVREQAEKEATLQKEKLLNQNEIKLGGSKLRNLAWSLDVLDLKKEEK